jgi:excisionase family DNA binding protein
MKPQTNRLFLTVRETAALLHVRPRTVRWLIREQQIRAQRVGDTFLIEETDLIAFIDAHTVPAHPGWEGGDGY